MLIKTIVLPIGLGVAVLDFIVNYWKNKGLVVLGFFSLLIFYIYFVIIQNTIR
jgi:hypothetical protein